MLCNIYKSQLFPEFKIIKHCATVWICFPHRTSDFLHTNSLCEWLFIVNFPCSGRRLWVVLLLGIDKSDYNAFSKLTLLSIVLSGKSCPRHVVDYCCSYFSTAVFLQGYRSYKVYASPILPISQLNWTVWRQSVTKLNIKNNT